MTVTRFNHWSERPAVRRLHRLTPGRGRYHAHRVALRLLQTGRRRRFALTVAPKTQARTAAPHHRLLT
jgi:hypothetical protein